MTNQNNQEKPLSSDSSHNRKPIEDLSLSKDGISKSDYVYELPTWDLIPPAAFVVRRVRRRK